MYKKILSAVMALLIVASTGTFTSSMQYDTSPMTASAEDYTEGNYGDLTYQKYDDHVVIIKCNRIAARVNIPAEIDDLPVTSIGTCAFSMCSKLSDVIIPDSVTSIGEAAFSECSRLTEITVPESVASIGEYAFAGCESLKKITIVNQDCEIYNTMYTITNSPFESENTRYDGVICGYPNSTAMRYALRWGYTFEILDDNYTEGQYDFLTYRKYSDHVVITDCHWEAENVEIPAEIAGLPVTEIGREAFADCFNLTSISFPDSVTSIGREAFRSCSNLTEITIPDSVNEIGAEAFSACLGLTKITLPDGITSIGYGAFEDCFELSEIVIPDSVKTIGCRAFSYCKNLTEIRIPDSVTSMDDNAFYYCEKLSDVTLSDSLTELGEYAFAWCSSLTEITIPNSVKSIGRYAFMDCSSLTEITILDPDCEIYDEHYTIENDRDENHKPYYSGIIRGYENSTAQAYAEKYGYTFEPLGREPVDKPYEELIYRTYDDHIAIVGCDPSAERVGIPLEIDGLPVTEIGSFAFAGCSELTYIIIPDTITAIGDNAFFECSSLNEIKIPDGVTKIEDYTFAHCTSLIGIIIPDSVTSIGWYAFSACSSLEKVTVPKSVTLIDKGAFYNCRDLEEITIFNPDCSIYDYSATIANENAMDWDGTYNGIIRGYENSTAQAYAEKYGYTFESLGEVPEKKITYGDANCDGIVSIADATAILQHLGNKDKYALSAQGEKNADVAEPAGITAADAIAIQQLDAGLIEKLPL